MDCEVWKNIVGWESLYEVSNFGRIRRKCKTRIAKPLTPTHNSKRGQIYPSVDLCKGYRRHRVALHIVVATAFCPNPHGYKYVGHKDNNPLHFYASNLEWTTQSKNIQRAYDQGRKDAKGERNGRAKLTEEQIREIRFFASKQVTMKEIAASYKLNPLHVGDIVRRKRWAHVE